MDVSQVFKDFVNNIIVDNQESIENRFATITKRLNTDFHNIDSSSENGIYVGSYGRDTAIKGVSDLDLLFVLPDTDFTRYNSREGNKQSQLLQDVKNSITKTYPQSKVRADGQVVVIEFAHDFIEVCPAFQENDNSFTYPDSNNNGSWKKTDPLPEAKEISNFNSDCNGNLINLCSMIRAWKNKCGVKIGGLLIDTLVYNFFKENEQYKDYKTDKYNLLVRDFFYYLKELDDDKKYWYSPGSNQHVYKKASNFKTKARKAFINIEQAIEKTENDTVYEIWRRVFGKAFPYPKVEKERSFNYTLDEQYIEDYVPLNITYKLKIDCRVIQPGFRVELLRELAGKLRKNKKLEFFVESIDVPNPYTIKWKIKNEGKLAFDKKCLRGQILDDHGGALRKESTSFEGEHFVECYIIKDGYCVARDRIDVPISTI